MATHMNTTKTILLADDEPDSVAMVTMRLDAHGYKVIHARNGQEAVAMAKREQPDLILLELLMPELNGSDAAALLRQDVATRHIPIIFLSAIAEALDVDRTFQAPNARWMLPKPFDSKKLLRLIEQVIEQELSPSNRKP